MCWCYSKSSTRTRNEGKEWENEPAAHSIGEGKDYGSQELELPQKQRFRKLRESRAVTDI